MTVDENRPPLPGSVDEIVAQLATLDIRQEELQVVSEELRVQQEQIGTLLSRHDAEVRWRSQLSAVVPLGLAVTDGNGKLLDVNPALATALGVAPGRLRGKPLSLYLSSSDALSFRDALRSLSQPAAPELRLEVHLRPRGGPGPRAELFGFTENPGPPASSARVQWVLALLDEEGPEGRPALPDHAGTGDATDVLGLAASFAQLSGLSVAEPDRQRLLSRMATLVRSAVAGADWVSITLGSPLDPQRIGSDSPQAQDFDGRQLRAEEGPCWDAYRKGEVVSTPDVRSDERWPRLHEVAGGAAVCSVLAVPVREEGETTGVLNL